MWDNVFVANYLQLKSLSHMFCLSFSSSKVYKQGVLFYIFIFKNMGILDESIKKNLTQNKIKNINVFTP
jgi:hypothetical protein